LYKVTALLYTSYKEN